MKQGSKSRFQRLSLSVSLILIICLCIPVFVIGTKGRENEPAREFTLDDSAAVYEGFWGENISDNTVDRYGTGFHYGWGGVGTKATYTVEVELDGWYQVYGWWCVNPNRAQDTPYTVTCGNQSGAVRVNQEINGGKWNRLYTVKASAGDIITVTISADADEYVISDAVRVVLEEGIVMDETDAVFTGAWNESLQDNLSDRFGNSFRFADPASGDEPTATAAYTTAIEETGVYKVYGWWTTHENRAQDTPHTITSGGSSQTVRINQEKNGGQWVLLGKVMAMAGESITVIIGNNADQYVIADAVKITQDDGVIDDDEAVYTGNSWVTEANDRAEERYGNAFRYAPWIGEDSEPNATAVYSTPVIADGIYSIYGWWTTYQNRSTNTPYILSCDGQSETVRVNQQENGGQWNYLGQVTANAGDTVTVTIANNANGYVIADAVKIVPGDSAPTLFDQLKQMLHNLYLPELENCNDPYVITEYNGTLEAAETLCEGADPGDEAVQTVMDSLTAAIEAVKNNQRYNLALGKPVEASNEMSVPGFWSKDYLTDGLKPRNNNSSIGYSTAEYASKEIDSPIDITIDLDSAQPISQVILYPRISTVSLNGGTANFPEDFEIQISEDGIGYRTVKTVTGQSDPEFKRVVLDFDEAFARYVRLHVTKLGAYAADEGGLQNPYRLQLSEIEVFYEESGVSYCNITLDYNRSGGTVVGKTAGIVAGSDTILTAFPAEGWVFSGWYIGENKIYSDTVYTFTVSNDMTVKAEFTETIAPPDKSELKQLIEDADAVKDSNKYAGAVFSAKQQFESALADARNVFRDSAATVQEIEKACAALREATAGLDKQAGKKERLAEAIAYANGLNLSKYVTAGQDVFRSALSTAETVNRDPEALQKSVNEAVEKLISATAALRLRPDKANLS